MPGSASSSDEPPFEVVFVAEEAGLADALLAEHVDDGTGHCKVCGSVYQGRVRVPCTIRVIAVAARNLRERRGLG